MDINRVQEEADVIVVGAGPTGLVLAGELAMRGIDVVVVERRDTPSGQSRGGGVSPRTCEVLAMRGLLETVTERAVPRDGTASGHFAMLPVPLDARPWRTRYGGGLMIPQDRLEEILTDRLHELGVAVRRGAELVGLDRHTVGVTVGVTATVATAAGESQVRARHLVACDGGHSTVRRLAGVAFPGRAGTMAAVSADVELAAVPDTVPRTLGHISTHTRTGGGYFMMLHPLGGAAGSAGLFRVVFGGEAQTRLPRDAPVTAEEVAAALVAVHGPGAELGRLRWGTRFSDAARLVERYRDGAVLFAGDAAHIHLPVGGQGLNLGVQDAMNLGWKLAAHIRGRGPDPLLDTYHAERHPVAARVIATTRAQSVLMATDPAADDVLALRDIMSDLARLPDANRYLAGLMSGLDIRYELGGPGCDPLVGSRMPDLALETAGGPATVSSLLRSGRGLLLELADAPGATAPPAEGLDHVVARVVDSPVGTELGAGSADRVLVRPDGYVCWAGTDEDAALEAALWRWFGVRS